MQCHESSLCRLPDLVSLGGGYNMPIMLLLWGMVNPWGAHSTSAVSLFYELQAKNSVPIWGQTFLAGACDASLARLWRY